MEISPQELKELFDIFSKNKPLPIESIPNIQKPERKEPPRKQSRPGFSTIQISYNNILQCILNQVGKNDFNQSDAVRIAAPALQYKDSMVIRALTYALGRGILARRQAHIYYFLRQDFSPEPVHQPRIDGNSLLDIVSSDARPIIKLLKRIAKARTFVTLLINQKSGISARFLSEDKVTLCDFRIASEVFSQYHCRTNLKITLDISETLRIMSASVKGFACKIAASQPEDNGFYEVNSHRIKYEKLLKSDVEFVHSLPLADTGNNAVTIQIDRSVLSDILQQISSESGRVSLTFNKDSLFLAPLSANPGFSKELYSGDPDFKVVIQPIEPRKVVFDVARLLDITRSARGGNVAKERLSISLNNDELLSIAFSESELVKLSYYILPIKMNDLQEPPTTGDNGNLPITPN